MALNFNGDKVRTSKVLKVGGVYLPTPKAMSVQLYDLESTAYRDLTSGAKLHKETIARDKVKLVCSWGYTSSDEAKMILNACNENEFTECVFYNPYKQAFDTINVYRGDREVEIYREIFNDDGTVDIDYNSITVNFIEG